MNTFRIPSFSVQIEIALLRARMVVKRDFRRAVEILRAAKITLESAIAMVARMFGAAA